MVPMDQKRIGPGMIGEAEATKISNMIKDAVCWHV